MKILVIDDSKAMRSIQKTVLAHLGRAEVVEASDGREALARLSLFKPDVILCDWNMPALDGLGFVRALRARNDDTPIIMITTENEIPQVIQAIKAGADNYLLMPFSPEQLCRRITETLERKAA